MILLFDFFNHNFFIFFLYLIQTLFLKFKIILYLYFIITNLIHTYLIQKWRMYICTRIQYLTTINVCIRCITIYRVKITVIYNTEIRLFIFIISMRMVKRRINLVRLNMIFIIKKVSNNRI
jgi:hypothetical protein